MKKVFRKELIIGALVLAALACLVFGIDFLKGINIFQPTNYYTATYTNVDGLAKSAPVTINGFKVGQVRDITYDLEKPGNINVELALESDIQLPSDTRALMTTDMLGTGSIVLQLGKSKLMHKSGDQLESAQAPGLMSSVTDNLMPAVTGIFPKVDTLLTTANTLLSEPAIAVSLHRLDEISANLRDASSKLNATLNSLSPIAGDVQHITGNVSQITGSFVSTADNINHLSGALREIPVDSLVAQLESTARNVHQLSQQLNNPNSTLGKLTSDPALYNNLNATVRSLDSLFTDIQRNPRRYINIKLL